MSTSLNVCACLEEMHYKTVSYFAQAYCRILLRIGSVYSLLPVLTQTSNDAFSIGDTLAACHKGVTCAVL